MEPEDQKEKPSYEQLLAELQGLKSGGPSEADIKSDEESRKSAKMGAVLEALGAGLGRASDTLFQGYTGKAVANPSGGYENNAIRQYLSDKADKRRASQEAADQKFKLAQYMQQQKMAEGRNAKEDSQFSENVKLKREEMAQKERLAQAAAAAKSAAGGPGGRALTSGTAKEIGEFDAAIDMADRLKKLYDNKAASTGSSALSYIPGTDAFEYDKDRDVAAQTIGGILEGGKLTEEDYNRYRDMLPKPTDTNSVAQVKVDAIKELITARKRGGVEALGQSGYNVANIPVAERKDIPSRAQGGKLLSGSATASDGPQEKTVNGKRYQKVEGGWKRID